MKVKSIAVIILLSMVLTLSGCCQEKKNMARNITTAGLQALKDGDRLDFIRALSRPAAEQIERKEISNNEFEIDCDDFKDMAYTINKVDLEWSEGVVTAAINLDPDIENSTVVEVKIPVVEENDLWRINIPFRQLKALILNEEDFVWDPEDNRGHY